VAAVVPDARVARAHSHAQGTGVRQRPETDQPDSPFSELLETSETPESGAPEPTSAAPEVSGKKPLPAQANATPPHGPPESPPGKGGAKGKSELVLSIVLPPGHFPDAEVPVVRTKLGATLSQAISNKPEPDSETDPPQLPAQADADAAGVTALAQLAPPPAVVPVPATIPAAAEATSPVGGEATAPSGAEVSVTAAIAAAPAPAPAPVAASAETGAKPTGSPAPDKKLEAPAFKTAAPSRQAPEATAPVASGSTEETAAPAEKVAHHKPEAATNTNKAAPAPPKPATDPKTSSDPDISSDPEFSPDPEVVPQAAEIAPQKTAGRPTEAAAVLNAARGDAEKDARPPAPEAPASSSNLPPPPATHAAAQHATPPWSQRPGLADMVPVAGLAVAIAAHAESGKNHFEIRLDPPELGRIDVRLDVDKDGQVTSHLRVERAETLDLLRRDAPALERALQQAGLKTSDNGLQFSLRDHSFSQHNEGRESHAMARLVVPDEKLVSAETQRHYGRLNGLGSGVDIRV
jgi:flagellar hook-length control protein FliK